MVRVCDAIMGSGKTSAAINYINEHPDKKFIYISPYLDEAARIKQACRAAHFVEPSNKVPQYDFKKFSHTCALIKEGRNIATTHAAFRYYTPETLNDIQTQGYTLIIDEDVDMLEEFLFYPDDLKILMDAGYVVERDGRFYAEEKEYCGVLSEMFKMFRSRELVSKQIQGNEGLMLYWVLPSSLITSFDDVIIMTYLFDGQSIHHLLEINGIRYERVGVELTPNGDYKFVQHQSRIPEYVAELKDKIHIIDNEKLNEVGDDTYAISMNWFQKNPEGVERLKKNVDNLFRNVWRGVPAGEKLWGTYVSGKQKLSGKGYTKSFLPFNARATNLYKTRTHLVYAANVFMNVNEKRFYEAYGIEISNDAYALSIIVQWIWRSAIRDGKDIYLYIPSRRMRTLLINWIESVSKEVLVE